MTARIADALAAALTGMLAGVLLMSVAIGGRYFENSVPASRPSPQAELGTPDPSMTTEGVSRPAAAGLVARTGAPDARMTGPLPTGDRLVHHPAPSGKGTAALAEDADPKSLRGDATWYDYRRGHAAAGPELRRALGAGWRGTTVRVSANGRTVAVVLSDWCGCPGGRVVDLDVRSFAVLADPAVGVLPVTVTLGPLPAPPATSTKGATP